MSTVAEIWSAIQELSPEERGKLETLLRPDWDSPEPQNETPPNIRMKLAEAGGGKILAGRPLEHFQNTGHPEMNPGWEESEFVFCDLRTAAQFIHRDNPDAARRFLVAAYDAFDFLARNPGLGRQRADLGFPELRSWRISGFRRYLIFYRELPDKIQIWRVLHGVRDLPESLNG